jgi:redox-sensitive bicupin YhaK (pirin superfamily)
MSNIGATEAVCTRHQDEISIIVEGRARDLGGFDVRRVLPASLARSVGPFVFFDEMGPADFPPGEGINVRPHPHIGLATITFLFDGEILHRDSLGFVQAIQPGAVNLMTAGRGIVHSERTSPERLAGGQCLHGLQLWMALPEDRQEIEPDFVHYPETALPVISEPGAATTVIIGEYNGQRSPVSVHGRTLYLAQQLEAGAEYELNTDEEQLAIYVLHGEIRIGNQTVSPGNLAVLTNSQAHIHAEQASRLAVIGGDDVGHREMFWNFVHTSRQRIEKAKEDWREGKFEKVPGDDEFIPLP